MQETLPKLTGKALANVSKFDKPDNKSYSSLDTVLERLGTCWGGGGELYFSAVLCDFRIVEGHIQMDKFFDRQCASILAKRGTLQLEDGSYQFTRDIRVKSVSGLHPSVPSLSCPCLCRHLLSALLVK